MTYKIKKMVNNGTEYKIGSIDSSNDTYADIVHLTQEQYDALENPDPDTLYSTPDNAESGEFAPENEGTVGQVLKKTATGYDWEDLSAGGRYIDLIIVAGGGGGGGSSMGGGGGGGAVKECISYIVTQLDTCVVIGARGNPGVNGGDTCFGDMIVYGGGAGGTYGAYGCNGGNGGGGGGKNADNGHCRGGYGKFGGNQGGGGNNRAGGGGGGAGGPGESTNYNDMSCDGGIGGQGYNSEIFCPSCLFGTGGTGGGCSTYSSVFPGGGPSGSSATFYGGGGGGAVGSSSTGGYGCQGVVMLRYLTDGSCGITCATGGTVTTSGDYTYHTFTSNGTFCIEC